MPDLSGLVCPECRSALNDAAGSVACGSCGKSYPVREGIPCFVELDPNAAPFKEEYFDFWFKRENIHFWHVARREIIADFCRPFLRAHFKDLGKLEAVEIGIGNGNVAKELAKTGLRMQGADLFYSSLQYCRKRLNTPLYQADVLKLPFREKFDFIGIYDILEHIEDDRLAIRRLYEALKPGGLLNVTVPACKFLWSKFDELDHKRRYGKSELVAKLKEAGFKIRRVSFFMFLLFPVVYVVRKLQKYPSDTKLEHVSEVRVVPVINGIFLWIFRLEKWLLKITNLPIGSSLIVLTEK